MEMCGIFPATNNHGVIRNESVIHVISFPQRLRYRTITLAISAPVFQKPQPVLPTLMFRSRAESAFWAEIISPSAVSFSDLHSWLVSSEGCICIVDLELLNSREIRWETVRQIEKGAVGLGIVI